jgi:hypothetical protein
MAGLQNGSLITIAESQASGKSQGRDSMPITLLLVAIYKSKSLLKLSGL